MVRLQESGHDGDGVRVVEKWMDQHQNDTSKDDFLHQQIAMVYISKVYHKQSTRDESIDNAASHVEAALGITSFVWTGTADSIFAKVERFCERIYGTQH